MLIMFCVCRVVTWFDVTLYWGVLVSVVMLHVCGTGPRLVLNRV